MSMLFFSMIPFLFAFLSIIFFVILKIAKPKTFKESYLRNWVTTNLVFIFLLYPSITSYAFGTINCMEIEGTSYLIRDFSIICWTPEHI